MSNKKTKRMTSDQMYPLIELYQESDKSRSVFCTEMNIKPHVFQYWLDKYRKKELKVSASVQSEFVPLEITPIQSKSTDIRHIRITSPSGLVIEIPLS